MILSTIVDHQTKLFWVSFSIVEPQVLAKQQKPNVPPREHRLATRLQLCANIGIPLLGIAIFNLSSQTHRKHLDSK